MVATVSLEGERVLLSAPTIDDADVDAITSCCQQHSVQRWTTVPSPYNRADALGFVSAFVPAGWEAGTTRTWAIRVGEPRTLVGMIGLDRIAGGCAEIGFWLSEQHRGLGLMTEAVRLVCDHAFSADGLGLQRVEWRGFVGNTASASVARRAGFRFEGTQRLGAVQRGTRLDVWSAALLSTDTRNPAADWPPQTATPA